MMQANLIQYIVYAITMCVIYAVIDHLNTRGSTKKDPDQTDENYIVKVPAALKWVYFVMFIFGIGLFAVFFFFHVRGVETATIGLIRFGLIVAAIGFLVMLWADRWRICVKGDDMVIHRLFRREQELSFSGIEEVKTTKKFQLMLYRNGKKIVTVDLLSDNYERFKSGLERHGKL